MKKILLLFTLFLCFINAQSFGHYDYGKIHLKTGFVLEGQSLVFYQTIVSINVSGTTKSFNIEEIKTIYSGHKSRFNLMGAFIGTAAIMTQMLIVGGDFIDYFWNTTLSLSIIGGTIIGFITPSLLQSVGRSKIKWNLLYSL